MAVKGVKVRVGEVYLPEARDTHALIISGVGEDGSIEYLKTSETRPERVPAESNPLEGYVLATPDRLKELIFTLDEDREIAQHESDFKVADFLRICSALIRAYCYRSSLREKASEESLRKDDSHDDRFAKFRCDYGDCTFSYFKNYEKNRLRFLSCPNAVPVYQFDLKVQCSKSEPLGGSCKHFSAAS